MCFAGYGEPLLRLDTLRETVRLVRKTRHGIPWRINTNGLHSVEVAQQVAEFAVDHDGRHPFVVSVMLAANSPPEYAKLMKPAGERGFNDVCSFVMALSEAGVTVEATAVAAPGTFPSSRPPVDDAPLYLAYALLHRATHCPTTRSPATTPCRAYPYLSIRRGHT